MTTAFLNLCLTRRTAGRKPPEVGQAAFDLIICIRVLLQLLPRLFQKYKGTPFS